MKNKIKFIALAVSMIYSVSCQINGKTVVQTENIKQSDNNYTLIYEIPYPGELFINDVLVDKSIFGVLSGTEFMNNFILENGVQHIKIELNDSLGKITTESLKKLNTDFGIYNVSFAAGEIQNMQTIQKLHFPENKITGPIMVGQWMFNAHLPFKLKGWKNSEDLSKWNKEKLEIAVVKKFNELRNVSALPSAY